MSPEAQSDDDQLIQPDSGDAETPQPVKSDWKAILYFTNALQLIVLLPALICSLIAGLIHPAMAVFSGQFFDTFSNFGENKIHGDELMAKSSVSIYSLVGIGVVAWIIKGGSFCLWLVYGEMQAKSARDALFQTLLERDVEWYEQRPRGIQSLLARLQTQIRELQTGTSQPLGFACTSLVEAAVSIGVAFYYSWRLTLIILSAIFITVSIIGAVGSGARRAVEAQNEALDYALKLGHNAIANIIVVKCFNKEAYETELYRKSIFIAAKHYLKQASINALQIGFARLGTTTTIALGIYYGTTLIHQGKSTAGKVLTTFWTCLGATRALEDILPHLVALEKGRAAAFALRRVLNHVEKGKAVDDPHQGLCPGTLEGDIEVQNVSFAYPTRPNHSVMRDASLFFPAGETTFLVGSSGSGKSTIANLLLKFYTTYTGEILIDGHDIRDLDTSWLRNNITLVQQQSVLFNETIFQNIVLKDKSPTQISAPQVREALSFAMLDESIAQLTAGMDTRVGAGGSQLSGGQKQRMAIARARFRDTPILILDESTSALDVFNRVAMMRNIRAWRKGKTTIIITHDLSQIANKDFVYVVKGGQVVAAGYRQALCEAIENSGIQEGISGSTGSDANKHKTSVEDGLDTSARHNRRFSFDDRDQDSIDVILDAIDENDPLKPVTRPAVHRNSTFAQDLGRRLSAHISTVLDDMKQQPSTFSNTLTSRRTTGHRQSSILGTHRSKIRSSRPMSMHQAIAMKSLYRQSQAYDRLHQDPAETPDLAQETASTSSHSVELPEVLNNTAEQRLSLKQVMMTIGPSLSLWDKALLLLGFLAATLHAASMPLLSYLISKLFTTFFLPTGWNHKATILSIGIFWIAVTDGIACYFMHYNLEACGQRWVDELRVQAVKLVLKQPKAWFDDKRNSSTLICSSLDRSAEEMRNLLGRFSASIYVVVVMVSVAAVWALTKCWRLTLVGMASASVMYLITKAFNHVSSIWEGRVNDEGDTVGAIFTEAFSDINTVRALTLESYFHKKYNRATSRAFVIGVQRGLYSGIFFGLSASAVHFVTATILAYGAVLAKSKSCSVESLLTVFSLLLFCTANANSIVAFIPQITSCVDVASRLIRLSRLPADSHEHLGQKKLDRVNPDTLSGDIQFIDQTFFYPSRLEPPALFKINLSIKRKEITAIVGSSGSGKSTITSLLLGMYPPSPPPPPPPPQRPTSIDSHHHPPPTLLVSGHDIRTLNISTLRSLTSIVPQTPTIIPGTIRDNILYGLDSSTTLSPTETETETELQLISAATSAGIHDFITSLPQGYDTPLNGGTTTHNSSSGLSGGQAQRIVIARALIRRPHILILDEATSALDGESARHVRNSVRELLRSGSIRTVVVVTHDREMMAWADRVVVLDRGRVVEQGQFDGLMRLRRKGWLWNMMNA